MSSAQLSENLIQNVTPVKNNNKQTKKRKISTIATTVTDNNDNFTTITATPSNTITPIVADANTTPSQNKIDNSNSDKSSTNNCTDDLNCLFESMKNDITDSTNTNTTKYTTFIDICKIYSIDSDQNSLVAITLSNFYAGRHHIKDVIFKSSKLFYNPYVNQLCKDKTLIKDVADIKYLFHKNLRPVTMISSYPTSENKYLFETMEETLKKLIIQYDGKPDPENEGKSFTFNFLPDYNLDTKDKKLTFLKICKLISLPDRLTSCHQVVMEHI